MRNNNILVCLWFVCISFILSCNNTDYKESDRLINKKDSVGSEKELVLNSDENIEFNNFFEYFFSNYSDVISYLIKLNPDIYDYEPLLDSVVETKSENWQLIELYRGQLSDGNINIISTDSINFRYEHLWNRIMDDKVLIVKCSVQNKDILFFEFELKDTVWSFISLTNKTIESTKDTEFLEFCIKFYTDSIYQRAHIKYPVEYIYYQTDNSEWDLITMNDKLYQEDFTKFGLRLKTDYILYFDTESIDYSSNYRTILKKSDLENDADHFIYENGQWYLYKMDYRYL